MLIALISSKNVDALSQKLREHSDVHNFIPYNSSEDLVHDITLSNRKPDRVLIVIPSLTKEIQNSLKTLFQTISERNLNYTTTVLCTTKETIADSLDDSFGSLSVSPAVIDRSPSIPLLFSLSTQSISDIRTSYYGKPLANSVSPLVSDYTTSQPSGVSLPDLSLGGVGLSHSDTGFLDEVEEPSYSRLSSTPKVTYFDSEGSSVARLDINSRIIVMLGGITSSIQEVVTQGIIQAMYFASLGEKVLYVDLTGSSEILNIIDAQAYNAHVSANPSALSNPSLAYCEDDISIMIQSSSSSVDYSDFIEYSRVIIAANLQSISKLPVSDCNGEAIIISESSPAAFETLLTTLSDRSVIPDQYLVDNFEHIWISFINDDGNLEAFKSFTEDNILWDRKDWSTQWKQQG